MKLFKSDKRAGTITHNSILQERYGINDELLVELLLKKDKDAFYILYDTYCSSLHGSIIDIIANRELAAEILEEVYITIWNTIHTYDVRKEKFFTWLLHIARRRTFEIMNQLQAWPDANQLANASINLHTILQKMDKGQRAVIELTYYRGYSTAQVAQLLKLPQDFVTDLLKTGLYQLQLHLNNYFNDTKNH
jgi:RNA polymerase sigma-70 factor (ECF subfamily)